MKTRIGIIFGGRSGEHEISLMSAMMVLSAIDRQLYDVVKIGITKQGKWLLHEGPDEEIETGRWEETAEQALREDPNKYELVVLGNEASLKDRIDFAFPVLHGPQGEDGTIQGLFEFVGIPYAGAGVLGSALAMDKAAAKELFKQTGLDTCPHMLVEREIFNQNPQKLLDQAEKNLPYPIFVKPANMGSSVGMSKAKNRKGLEAGIRLAARYDRRIILEEGIDARELETGILGNHQVQTVPVGEIRTHYEFYDYEAKYDENSGTALYIPADITKEQNEQIREMALKACKALDCQGFARVDFFMEKATGRILINEINTIPGFTKYSMFPLLCKEMGIGYSELIQTIINLGFERFYGRQDVLQLT